MVTRRLVLVIDAGTTGVRAMVFGADQKVVAGAYQEFPQIFPRPGWVEHDPDQIWQTTRTVVEQATRGISANSLCGLGITNQRETALLWDRETGRPVHNAIVWQCRRTAPQCQRLKDEGHGPHVHRKTGLRVDPYFSATKWRWLLDHVPEAGELLKAGRLVGGTVDTWLLWNLTGGTVHATEPSNGSRTCLLNIETLRWDDDLCRLFGVPMDILPDVFPTRGEFGQTDPSRIGFELPVLAMVGDQQAAAFAQGCFGPGTVKNTYGTGLFMLCNTGGELILSDHLLSTVAWSCDGKTDYALLAGLDPSDEMAFALSMGKLWSVHLNDQNGLKFDQDKSFGTANLRGAFNQVRVLELAGYAETGRFVGLDVKAMRTQKAEVAHKHLSNSRTVFLKLVEKVRTFPKDVYDQCLADRDYEALELAVLEHLMGG